MSNELYMDSIYLAWHKSHMNCTAMQDQAASEIKDLREQLAKANERLNNPQGLQELVCLEQMKEIPLIEIHRANQRLHEDLAKANERIAHLQRVARNAAYSAFNLWRRHVKKYRDPN